MQRPLVLIAFIAFVTAVLTLASAKSARAQNPDTSSVDVAAPTIETVTILARGPSEIQGKGRPGSVVRLMSAEQALGEATVADNGQWRILVKDGLPPGIHQIQAGAVEDGLLALLPGDEVRISVPPVLGDKTVVSYENGGKAKPTGDVDETRRRAEGLAEAAGAAFEEIVTREAAQDGAVPGQDAPAAAAAAKPGADAAQKNDGTLTLVVEWLKRSARAYRDEIVEKLTEQRQSETRIAAGETEREEISAAEAARRIGEERRAAEEAAARKRALDKARRAAEAEKTADAKARKEAEARRKAEELERRKAEADKRISDSLKELEKAAAAKRAAATAAQEPPSGTIKRPKITLEAFSLPGDDPARAAKSDMAEVDSESGEAGTGRRTAFVKANAAPRARPAKAKRRHVSGRCHKGHVFKRNGRRWYRTGRDDTLWDIAERFYGRGMAYPRIYRANRARMKSPHIVRPCLALRLPKGRR